MRKKFPALDSDDAAEAWLQSADLASYDLSSLRKVRFEFAPKDASISLRLPGGLLAALKANAAKAGMPTQRFIRMLIEAQLADAQPSAKVSRKPATTPRRRNAA